MRFLTDLALPQKLGHGFCEILTELRGPRLRILGMTGKEK